MSPELLDHNLYSPDYETARARFRAAVDELKRDWAGSRSWALPIANSRDADLSVDFAHFPARAKARRLFVLVSGVHGVEGFAGSALQLMFLKEFAREWGSESALLIVHAMNPFGFKFGRRATEHNVNLNRNYSLDPALYRTENPAYGRLQKSLEPAGPLPSFGACWRRTARHMFALLLTKRATLRDLEQSIGQGQYASPRGLEFGGSAAESQTRELLERIREFAADVPELILFDLHSGLGERGELHLMPGDGARSVDPALFAKLFRPAEDRALYAYTPNETAGFYHTGGDLNQAVTPLLTPGQKALALTLEFGTLGNGIGPKLETLIRLIAENQSFHFGCANARAAEVTKQKFRELFLPDDRAWRESVVAKTRGLFATVQRRFSD